LDDAEIARALPAGSTGDAAVYTDHVKLAHVIRKVLLRQIAICAHRRRFFVESVALNALCLVV
jgi:hypothetical protein